MVHLPPYFFLLPSKTLKENSDSVLHCNIARYSLNNHRYVCVYNIMISLTLAVITILITNIHILSNYFYPLIIFNWLQIGGSKGIHCFIYLVCIPVQKIALSIFKFHYRCWYFSYFSNRRFKDKHARIAYSWFNRGEYIN